MTKFLKLWRLAPLCMLLLMSMPVFAQSNCFAFTQPPKPTYSKQGGTIFVTYKLVGIVQLSTNTQCKLFDEKAQLGENVSAFGYTYSSQNFKFNIPKVSSAASCNPTIDEYRRLVFTFTTNSRCLISLSSGFEMVYPLTGSYTGSNPVTDIIYIPRIISRTVSNGVEGAAFTNASFINGIAIPPEPARTCSLTHPSYVRLDKTDPSVFTAPNQTYLAGGFSVTLGCAATTSARTGTPSLKFAYPSSNSLGFCAATNQAASNVSSPVVVQIKGPNGAAVCGDSAIGTGTVHNFAAFSNANAYASTLNFTLFIASQNANPGPGIFNTAVTLEVNYP